MKAIELVDAFEPGVTEVAISDGETYTGVLLSVVMVPPNAVRIEMTWDNEIEVHYTDPEDGSDQIELVKVPEVRVKSFSPDQFITML